MSTEEKNRNEILSRMAADLFVKSTEGEELSSKIHRIRGEIKKVIESEDTIYGKFRGLVESFREIIPEEKQRYHAAIKALSTTSKVSRQDIVKAVNNQLEELKILEKGLSTPSGWRDELKFMEAKSREMRDEISKLREKIGRLESEEKEILSGMAAREKEMELVSKAVGELFTDIGADITYIKKRVEEFTAESAVPQPLQPIPHRNPVKSAFPGEEKGGGGQKSEVRESPAPQKTRATESQKPCPMCGGRMDFYTQEKKWRCFSCAFEELKEEKGGGGQKSEIREPSAPQEPQDTKWQRKCPMCGGRMDFYIHENMWICFSCAYESKDGEVQDESEDRSEQTNAPKPTPASEPMFDPFPSLAAPPGEIHGSSAPQEPQDTNYQKTCPMCGGRMDLQIHGEKWVCYSCAYEELKKDEGQGIIEEKSEQKNAPNPAPHGDSSKRDIPSEKRGGGEQKSEVLGSSAPQGTQDTKWQRKCPMCGGRMDFYIREKMWICFSCAYESKDGEVRDESEERREQANAPKPIPGSIQESKKGSSRSHQQPLPKKTCPVCRKKMNWHNEEKAWRCPFCDYERKI